MALRATSEATRIRPRALCSPRPVPPFLLTLFSGRHNREQLSPNATGNTDKAAGHPVEILYAQAAALAMLYESASAGFSPLAYLGSGTLQ
ncbi:hypothetical protein WOLCODRAFT_152895 [Wolfiporia cocos MD-104 SS10]|uniref:Uncharacterized protein n=1 Tax=Wolfiporia cocos (strain MD-104) TaxID=742152 RepID=A0A2H3JKX3_WOLCO|nr:hypothetical protein WOLCODRAFT_152895 [Wolfiporia cocos MD-104 SS10]